jgi:hypothetical protein
MYETKICTCCNLEFEKTEKYFYKKIIKQQNKNGIGVYYSFRSICKVCYDKKGNDNRIKKRCKEMSCDFLDYRLNWKKQYSKTRTIDLLAKEKLTEGQYNVYKTKIKKQIISNIEEYYKNVFKNKHSKPWMRKYDYGNVDFIPKEKLNKSGIVNLTDAYIALTLKAKVKDVPKEILQTKRLIIQLKRELNYGN